MSHCPRCGRLLQPDESQCPSCRRGVVTTVVVSVVALALIAVLVAIRIDHRGTAGASPAAAASSPAAGPGSTTTPDRSPGMAQASVIAGYLTRSGRVRHHIGAAISAISGCGNIASAVASLHKAAKVRAHIAESLAGADVSALHHGTIVLADLRRAMRSSATADRHYAAWGRAVAGCYGHAPHTAQFAAARRSDARATAVKRRFADEWNPIAAMYGLPRENANSI